MPRPRSIRRRLIGIFALFAGGLLLITWIAGLIYFFWSERNDMVQSVQTSVSILAMQNSAAVMFNDGVAMNENLSSLRLLDSVRWAAILASPTAAAEPRWLAQFGKPPERLTHIRDELERSNDVVIGLTELTVRRPIVHDQVARGELLVHVDLRGVLNTFLLVLVVSLSLFLALLLLSVLAANRIVSSVVRPIRELAFLAENVVVKGSRTVRAKVEQDDEVGQLALSLNRMLDALNAKERAVSASLDQLRELTTRLRDIREEERKRISHEIHDELGQRLTAIKFALSRADDAATRAQIGTMIDATIQVVRNISWELRPAILDSLGLAPAIEWLATDFQLRMGIRCGVAVPSGKLDLDAALVTDAFRICQELLTNITRHARASRVDIRLTSADGVIGLEVEDDGIGMPAAAEASKSLGLLGIRERCERWGGSLELARGAQGSGTCVRVRFVCKPPPAVSGNMP